MARRKINQRGLFLLETVVMIILLAFIGAAGLLMVMGRAMVVNKGVTKQKNMFDAQNAQSVINTCLQNVTSSNCNNSCNSTSVLNGCGSLTCSAIGGYSMTSQDGKTINVSLSWNNGTCATSITVLDP